MKVALRPERVEVGTRQYMLVVAKGIRLDGGQYFGSRFVPLVRNQLVLQLENGGNVGCNTRVEPVSRMSSIGVGEER